MKTYRVEDLPERLQKKIAVNNETGCWEWQGNLRQGYGKHRMVYTILCGDVQEGLHLDHLCRVRSCCNPAHLEPVTVTENNRRAVLSRWEENKKGVPRFTVKNFECANEALKNGMTLSEASVVSSLPLFSLRFVFEDGKPLEEITTDVLTKTILDTM